MDVDTIRNILAGKDGGIEEYPFGPEVMVFKVGGKIFALIPVDQIPVRINLKCDPDDAKALRASYDAIQPGYHMNKVHWNTVTLDGSLPDDLVHEMIDQSYALIVQSLPKSVRVELRYSSVTPDEFWRSIQRLSEAIIALVCHSTSA